MADLGQLSFPYMFWAHTESFRSAYCLAQSGMPLPAAEWLALDAKDVLAPSAVRRARGWFHRPFRRIIP